MSTGQSGREITIQDLQMQHLHSSATTLFPVDMFAVPELSPEKNRPYNRSEAQVGGQKHHTSPMFGFAGGVERARTCALGLHPEPVLQSVCGTPKA